MPSGRGLTTTVGISSISSSGTPLHAIVIVTGASSTLCPGTGTRCNKVKQRYGAGDRHAGLYDQALLLVCHHG